MSAEPLPSGVSTGDGIGVVENGSKVKGEEEEEERRGGRVKGRMGEGVAVRVGGASEEVGVWVGGVNEKVGM